MLNGIASSILNAGFYRLFLSGHSGNELPGGQALTELIAEDACADSAHFGRFIMVKRWA